MKLVIKNKNENVKNYIIDKVIPVMRMTIAFAGDDNNIDYDYAISTNVNKDHKDKDDSNKKRKNNYYYSNMLINNDNHSSNDINDKINN